MAPFIEQPHPEAAEYFEPLAVSSKSSDVPGLAGDRIGTLYADEERKERKLRTERLIREAEALQ